MLTAGAARWRDAVAARVPGGRAGAHGGSTGAAGAGAGAGTGAEAAAPGGVAGDRGVSTVEVVILAPVMILFILVLVAFGQLVDGRGAVDGAARDAARAGSLQRDQTVAQRQALDAAKADLADTCVDGTLQVHQTSPGFDPGDYFSVEVSCDIRGLGSLGLDIRKTITSKASSPLDRYRRAVAD
jgi:hypothetical protein